MAQEQIRSRTTEPPAIRRLLFPSEPEVQDASYFRDFSGAGQLSQTDINLEINSTISSNPSSLQGNPSPIHPTSKSDKGHDPTKREGSVKQQRQVKGKSRRMLAFEDYVNATQAWTSSCTTILLALHARAQTRIEEFQNTRAVKALVEDLPKFARRVAPSTPTRLLAVENLIASPPTPPPHPPDPDLLDKASFHARRKSIGDLVAKSALLWMEALWKILAFQVMVFFKTVMQQGVYIGEPPIPFLLTPPLRFLPFLPNFRHP